MRTRNIYALTTFYKKKLLDICTDAYSIEKVTKAGELELVVDPKTTIHCRLIYHDNWQTEIGDLLA